MNIYEKMSAITAELQTVAKNLTVGEGKNKYKAVSERDILDSVKPIEAKHGVYSYPYSREVLESNMLETETQYGVKTTFMTRIKTVYRFVNTEKPDEYIETITFAEGIDSQDKGSGKAMTYADKYALMKAYKISTGDDPDQTASEPTQYTKATPKQEAPKQTERPMPPRARLIKKLNEMKINIEEYAKEKGLNHATTDARYEELLEELEVTQRYEAFKQG